MRSRRMISLALALSVGLPASVAIAQDLGQTPGTVRLNAIIQDLMPTPRASRQPAYRSKVKRVAVPVRKRLTTTYVDDATVTRRYVLNYNHSVDLDIFFPFDSAAITPRARASLDVLGEALSSPQLRDAVYLLAGHTDARGKAGYNQWLSERRAAAVRDYLTRNFPIDSTRLVPVGFGEEELLDPDAPNGAINRRVEVTLIEAGVEDAPQVGRVEEPAAEDTTVVVEETVTDEGVPAMAGATGNVVCDTSPAVLSDSRPATNDLDDFGGVRTPVECEDVHDRSADVTAPAGTINDLIQN